MSVEAFCDRHGISSQYFYLLRKRGAAPRVMKLGARSLITVEEAARWRAEHTAPAAPTNLVLLNSQGPRANAGAPFVFRIPTSLSASTKPRPPKAREPVRTAPDQKGLNYGFVR
jgi:hypothetical protein